MAYLMQQLHAVALICDVCETEGPLGSVRTDGTDRETADLAEREAARKAVRAGWLVTSFQQLCPAHRPDAPPTEDTNDEDL